MATTNRLMLLSGIFAVHCENHKKHTNTLCGKNAEFFTPKMVVHIVTIVQGDSNITGTDLCVISPGHI
jgi:translation initiation factor IF-1